MIYALAIVAIGFLILIHEFGHFLVARAFGMKVESFSIGFGPALLSVQGRKTEYRLSMLPLGGYVRIAGMAPGDGTAEDDPDSFANKPAWQRFLVIFAGPFVNWLFAFLLLAGMFIAQGVRIDSHEPVIGMIADNSPAATIGLQSGDRILAVSGEQVETWDGLVAALQKNRGRTMELQVRRGDDEFRRAATTGADGKLGIGPVTEYVPTTVTDAASEAFLRTGRVVQQTLASFAQLFQGKSKAQVMGPVGIVSETVEAARGGLQSLFGILVLISLALALMNLLPLPALDGGRLVFITIAMIRRRPVDAKLEAVIHGVGMLLLLGLVLYATYGDIGRQLGKARSEVPAPPAAAQQEARP